MPQLIFKGVNHDIVRELSNVLPSELAEISNTPVDYFTLECPTTKYYRNGEEMKMYPLVEVLLFDRGPEIEEKMATCIADHVKMHGYTVCEVYFMHIGNTDYYEF